MNRNDLPESIVSILIVEDDEDDYVITRDMLRNHETFFRIDWVKDYNSALKRIAANDHDVYLIDYRLGVHNGLELIREAFGSQLNAPVIMLTGYGDFDSELAATELGVTDYLNKDEINPRLLDHSIRYSIFRHQIERKLQHDALHDGLTGLPNRTLFIDRVNQALLRIERDSSSIAILFLDLDKFKAVNDIYGHAAGDELLIAVGQRIDGMLRPSDTVCRLGGDEFVILLDPATEEDVSVVVERIHEAFDEPFIAKGHHLTVKTSLGFALSAPELDADALMQRADAEMYAVKKGLTASTSLLS